MPQAAVSHNQPPPPLPPPAAPMIAQQWTPPLWWPPVYPGPIPVAGGTFPSGGTSVSGGTMPLTMTLSSVQPLQPMPSEPSPVSPVVQTLDKDDDEDIAEDQPMPAQPLLPARRPRASSIADPEAAVEAPVETAPTAAPGVPTSVEAPVQVVPVAPAIDASSEGAVAPFVVFVRRIRRFCQITSSISSRFFVNVVDVVVFVKLGGGPFLAPFPGIFFPDGGVLGLVCQGVGTVAPRQKRVSQKRKMDFDLGKRQEQGLNF